jgi:amino acid adenylation domain-containing protein
MVAKLTQTSIRVEQPEQFLFPLSFAQQRLWFLDQLEGRSAVYNVKLPVHLHGALDLECLQQAVDTLVNRHESLRTSFSIRHGIPTQVVTARVTVPVQTLDMSGAHGDEIRTKVAELAGQPFDLDQAPLFRVHLLRLGPHENLLLLLTHHIVSDAWSSSIMFRDLASAYDALVAGQMPKLPELTVQYADYAVWQRDWLEGPALDQQLDYWKKKLAGAPKLLELPTDRPRPRRQTYNGSRVSRLLSSELTAALNQLAQRESCTLFMVLLTALNILLARYSGQDDVLVGSPIAGRRRTELEDLIGLFVNTLVFRTDVSGDASYQQLLAQVRAAALEAYAHQDLPFEKLVEALQPPRDMSYSPIFQVMFIHQNAPWDAQPISSLEVEPGEIGAGETAKFDLTVSTTEFDGVLYLNFEYNTDLFDCSTIERFAAGFETLLESIVSDPTAAVHTYPLHSDEDQYQVLVEWNRTEVDFARDQTVHGLIEHQVQRTPTATALECDSKSWCYAELNERADALASELRRLGINGPVPVIAVCFERSLQMVSAALGVLKAGAGYLPMDPAYPADRLDFMLQDSGVAILVTAAESVHRFAGFTGTIVGVDGEGWVQEIRPSRRDDTESVIDFDYAAEPLAYLIYTSGSTGLPKGVGIPHRAVVNFLTSMARIPGMANTDRTLAVTTLCFDISVLELFLPLTVGGTTVIAPADVINDGVALSDLLERAAISVMQATPATWRLLLNAGWRGRDGLRILCGGEPLDRDLAERLRASGQSLWNMYGPTETTIWSTCQRVDGSGPISIGRPIANTQTYILDLQMQPAPVGVAGELYIGGEGVAIGYHRRDALTAERFINNPFVPGARLYRTGDRARYRSDGTIELLGRSDQQVKLRGFRIELGEIEAVLSAHPAVAASAVELRERRSSDRSLVAYVVFRATPISFDALRAHLRQRLPDYMVPALFVPLAQLPMTPNGKLDRRSLPPPDWQAGSPRPQVAPRTPVESALCSLFKDVLGIGQIGVHDNFFDLGGHSLLATQLVSRIRDALDVELPLRVLFDSPTVQGLSGYLDNEKIDARILALRPRDTQAQSIAPASFMQQRLWFLDQLEPGNPVYNLVWSNRLCGKLDVGALERAVTAVVCRHEILRTSFIEQDGTPMQLIADDAATSVWLESLDDVSDDCLDQRMIELAKQPFDLHTGPLWRVNVLRLSEHEHVLMLVVHHIISDGWSMSVLFRELATAYNALRHNASPDWPRLPVQYADYAIWQREWLAGEELDRQMDYWREQLTAAPLILNLPADRPRPVIQTSKGARVGRQISRSLTTQLHTLSREEECTLFMVLLAAFDVVLGHYAGQQEVLVGTPIAGRNRTELEGLCRVTRVFVSYWRR